MKEAPVKRGDVLAGKYRVESVLGMGGMGVVVAATHLELLEPRAIKLMLPEALESQESVERFLREARAASRLLSEHVARVHDVGRLPTGAPYMVMEYLAGADLRVILRQRGRIPVGEAVLYALQASEALAEAHAAGIVHRDLKPANLFLTARRDGSPCIKVLDFGISKVRSTDDPEMTTTQAVLGSPTYMSPEQMRSARSVDARTDVWSLGVILYRLITGDPPFQADNLTELITLVISTTPVPPSQVVPDVPEGFDDVLLRCLERDLDQRWASVGELAAALLPFAPEEARGSVDRINRLLSGAGKPRSVPPPRSPPKSPTPRRASGTHPPWASTPRGDGRISMRRSAFVVLAALAGGLALAGAVALAASVRLRYRGPSLRETAPHVSANAAVPPSLPMSPIDDPPPEFLPPEPLPSAPSAQPSLVAPRPTSAPRTAASHPKPVASKVAPELPPPPPAPAPPPPAPTAHNRLFGTDN
jgi:serine/threonine-protein kinase